MIKKFKKTYIIPVMLTSIGLYDYQLRKNIVDNKSIKLPFSYSILNNLSMYKNKIMRSLESNYNEEFMMQYFEKNKRE